MKILLFLSAFLFFNIASFGQTQKIDGLKRGIYAAKNNNSKLDSILRLCDEYESLPKDTLWNYAIKAKALATALNDPGRKTLAIWAQAEAYIKWDNPDSASALIAPEIPKYKVENAATRDIYFKLAQLRIDCIGTADNNYKEAFAQIYTVMHQAETYKDSVIVAESLNTLGALNYDMNFVDKAIQWGYKGIAYTSNTPRFYPVLCGLSLNLAGDYWWTHKLDSATFFINKAMYYGNSIQDLYLLSRVYEMQACIFRYRHDYPSAEKAMLQSINMIKRVDGDDPQEDQLTELAALYRAEGNIDKSINVLTSGLAAENAYRKISPHAKKNADARDLQKIFLYQELARCYKQKGDSKNYEAYLEKIIAGKDSFYTTNSANAIAELETKYQVQKKEATIAQQQLTLVRDNYMFYGSVVVAILGCIIVLLIFREVRRKQKQRLLQLRDEEQRLSAAAVASGQEKERKRIAADLHDNLGAQLSFIKRNVNFIIDRPEGFNRADERKYLDQVNDTAQNAMVDLRETIWVLNRDEVGIQEFADKLKSYLRQQLLDRNITNWEFRDDISQNWKLSSGEVMHLFRIVQEVISNIIKHAYADHISITLSSHLPQTYQLEINDNGKGFDINSEYDGHYGLENIQARSATINAELLIESAFGEGTRVLLTKAQNKTDEIFEGAESSGKWR